MDKKVDCQITNIPGMARPMGRIGIVWQLRNRIKRLTKRRWVYLKNLFKALVSKQDAESYFIDTSVAKSPMQPGDIVRVRSRNEIQATLSRWNGLGGCAMMEEMWSYCNTRQRVFKRVAQFLDERDYLIKKTSGIVLLEGVICNGTIDFGKCDRSCYFFWREEWLERITGEEGKNNQR